MCAFDLETPERRDQLKNALYKNKLLVLSCGATTIRFRPPLTISPQEIDEAIQILDETLKTF